MLVCCSLLSSSVAGPVCCGRQEEPPAGMTVPPPAPARAGDSDCLHTHLARDSTQITLIHFKPTLSPEALQQILLKPCLHNVGRPIPAGDTWSEDCN